MQTEDPRKLRSLPADLAGPASQANSEILVHWRGEALVALAWACELICGQQFFFKSLWSPEWNIPGCSGLQRVWWGMYLAKSNREANCAVTGRACASCPGWRLLVRTRPYLWYLRTRECQLPEHGLIWVEPKLNCMLLSDLGSLAGILASNAWQ